MLLSRTACIIYMSMLRLLVLFVGTGFAYVCLSLYCILYYDIRNGGVANGMGNCLAHKEGTLFKP